MAPLPNLKNQKRTKVGLGWLLDFVGQPVPPPFEQHFAEGTVRSHKEIGHVVEKVIPVRRAPQSLRGHLEYALKNEALDLRVWHAICRGLGSGPFVEWIKENPTSKHARRACYLYERLTSEHLPVENSTVTNYAPLALSELQHTSRGQRDERFKIVDNLLGTFDFCPLVRKTARLEAFAAMGLESQAQQVIEGIDASQLSRAIDFLFHKETKASFQIEREDISNAKMARFVEVLRTAGETRWYTKEELIAIHNAIVDPRYAESDYRAVQNYVGQSLPWGEERVHCPFPKPENVPSLMDGWLKALFWSALTLDPVCLAAILGFGFVFIHPFVDGNGRLHRFVIQAVLARRGFIPSGVAIPISATMHRQREQYDAVLEVFSKPVMKLVRFSLDSEGCMTVHNDTAFLYRYWDATPHCEYLYETIAESIAKDLPEELRILRAYDAGREALTAVVDMPNQRADLLMRLLIQNGYRLSKSKRNTFSELSDEELERIESTVKAAAERATDVEPWVTDER